MHALYRACSLAPPPLPACLRAPVYRRTGAFSGSMWSGNSRCTRKILTDRQRAFDAVSDSWKSYRARTGRIAFKCKPVERLSDGFHSSNPSRDRPAPRSFPSPSRQHFFNQTEPAHRGVSCLQQTPLGIVNNVPLRAAGKLTAAERRNE